MEFLGTICVENHVKNLFLFPSIWFFISLGFFIRSMRTLLSFPYSFNQRELSFHFLMLPYSTNESAPVLKIVPCFLPGVFVYSCSILFICTCLTKRSIFPFCPSNSVPFAVWFCAFYNPLGVSHLHQVTWGLFGSVRALEVPLPSVLWPHPSFRLPPFLCPPWLYLLFPSTLLPVRLRKVDFGLSMLPGHLSFSLFFLLQTTPLPLKTKDPEQNVIWALLQEYLGGWGGPQEQARKLFLSLDLSETGEAGESSPLAPCCDSLWAFLRSPKPVFLQNPLGL